MERRVQLVIILCLAGVMPSLSNTFQLNTIPADMVVSSYGEVFVGEGKMLLRLNADLIMEESRQLSRNAYILDLALNSNESRVVACMSDGSCLVHFADYFDPFGADKTLLGVIIPESSFALLTAKADYGDSIYVGSEGMHPPLGQTNIILLGQYSFASTGPSRSSESEYRIESSTFISREFFGAFKQGRFVYFIVMDNGTDSSVQKLRVLRVCDEPEQRDFNALYEATLECGPVSMDTTVSSLSVVDRFGGMSGARAIVGISGGGQNRICSFSIADIDREMHNTFEECAAGNAVIPLVWTSYPFIDNCTRFSKPDVNECNFGSKNSGVFVPALATFQSLNGTTVTDFGSVVEEITAALAVKVDSVSLLYIAYSNESGHFLDKYHVKDGVQTGGERTSLVVSDMVSASVFILQWAEGIECLFAAMGRTIFRISLEDCSAHTDCSSCTGNGDPLCGWCTLESKCSRRSACKNRELRGRWVQDINQCISSIVPLIDSLSVDNIKPLEVSTLPNTANIPETNEEENYYCLFANDELQYFFTAPFAESACDIPSVIPTFTGPELVVDFMLLGPKDGHLYTVKGMLTLYNCSFFTCCKVCVEFSSVCGWCVYTRTCSGKSTACQVPEQWRSLSPFSDQERSSSYVDVCPTVQLPARGHYVHPIAVARVIEIHSRNIPPPIPEFRYECALTYSDGTVIKLPAIYMYMSDDEESLSCQAFANEVSLSQAASLIGKETVMLTLLWVSKDGQHEYEIEYAEETVDVVLYNCSHLAFGCSSCLGIGASSDFDCGWCSRSLGDESCSVSEECTDTSSSLRPFSIQSEDCPLPTIFSINPDSGPAVGGTQVTIVGSNLGVTVDDVAAVMFGESPCYVDESGYIPGQQIVCNTSSSAVSRVDVVVILWRNQTMVSTSTDPTKSPRFMYAVPSIITVFPLYGPMSGGTLVIISGSWLNIGNSGDTRVELSGVTCDVQHISDTEIQCVSQPRHVGVGLIQVQVDGFTAFGDGIEYEYTSDPVFSSVFPSNTIPAGRVILTFSGKFLDVVQEPKLVVGVGEFTLSGSCIAHNSTTLDCTAPSLPEPLTDLVNESILLNYTLLMDSAPGPSRDSSQLLLSLKPNPVFLHIHENDLDYQIDSGGTIRILGTNLDSVLEREVHISVGDQECAVVVMNTMIVFCQPPNLHQSAATYIDVKVMIGNGALTYRVGSLHLMSSSGSGEQVLPEVIIPAIIGTILIVFLGTVAIGFCIMKRRTKPERVLNSRSGLDGEDNKQAQMIPAATNITNVYGGGPGECEENLYEVIPDYITDSTEFTFEQPDNSRENIYENDGDEPAGFTSLEREWGNLRTRSRRRILPPLPNSSSDVYVEMRSQSISSSLSIDAHPSSSLTSENIRPPLVHQPTSMTEYIEMFPAEDEELDATGKDTLDSKPGLEHQDEASDHESNMTPSECSKISNKSKPETEARHTQGR